MRTYSSPQGGVAVGQYGSLYGVRDRRGKVVAIETSRPAAEARARAIASEMTEQRIDAESAANATPRVNPLGRASLADRMRARAEARQ